MMIDGKCRVCGIKLTVEAEDDYMAEGFDPMGLMKLLTCNRCYDYKTNRENIEDKIKQCCIVLIQAQIQKGSETWQRIRLIFISLTRRYAELVQRYNHYPTVLWDEDFSELLMDKPHLWWKIMANYRIHARDNSRQHRRESEKALGQAPLV